MPSPTDRGADPTVPTAPPPVGTGAGPAVQPPLRRPRDGRILAGVAAGIADHFGIDVAIVRILVVVFTVITEGLGLLVYLVAALLIPAAEPGAPRRRRTRAGHPDDHGGRDPLFWVGLGLLVIGALWLGGGGLAAGGAFLGGSPQLLFPVVLIALGLALWRAGDRRGEQTAGIGNPPARDPDPRRHASTEHPMTYDPSTSSTLPSAAAFGTAGPTIPGSAADDPTTPVSTVDDPSRAWDPRWSAGGAPPPWDPGRSAGDAEWTPPPEPERRPRSLLTRITLGVALVTIGVLWSLTVADVLMIGWGTILAAGLLVVGLGLLAGSVFGRARWLVLVGVLIAPVVLLAQLGPLPYLSPGWEVESSSVGDIRRSPDDLSELEPEYQLGAGSIRLDLRELDLDGGGAAVRVDVGAGEIEIVVPDDLEVAVVARSGIGQVRLFDVRNAAGIGAGEQQTTFTPDGTRTGRLELDLQVGIGEVRVEATARPDPSTPGR